MSEISIQDLEFGYPGQGNEAAVLKGLSLTVRDGEFLTLLGTSGCGKSTLLSILAGLNVPRSGRVLLDGQPLTGPGTDRAMVFQQPSLFPWLTARDNVAFAARRARPHLSRRMAREAAGQALEQVDLAEAADKYPFQMSGGMQQRAAIARALAADAGVLLMDEPFGALDPKNRVMLQQLLSRLMAARRRTVVFVTHDVDEAILLSDRVAFLAGGRVERQMAMPFDSGARQGVLLTPEGCTVRKQMLTWFYRHMEEGETL